jgi:enoyl-CoA hydratase
MSELVSVDIQQHTVSIAIQNPPVNAASSKVLHALLAAFDQAEAHADARAIIFTGAGDRAFCAGGDLREEGDFGTPEGSRAYRALGRKVLRRIESSTLPIIAAIHGYCIGGGTALAWACDLRLAADNARFRAADAYLGMLPSWGMGLTRLPRYVGRNRASDILLLGEDFDAATAMELGLLTRVVPRAELMTVAHSMADRIAQASPLAIKATRRAIAYNSRQTWAEMERYEEEACEAMFGHPDAHEGPLAFAEKRKPVFRSKHGD